MNDVLPTQPQFPDFMILVIDRLNRDWKINAEIFERYDPDQKVPDKIDLNFVLSFPDDLIESKNSESLIQNKLLSDAKRNLYAIAALERAVSSADRNIVWDADLIATVICLALDLGKGTAIGRLFHNPQFERLIRAGASLDMMVAARKGSLAPWVEAFLPVAEAFCAGRQNVTYGQLRRRAREWSDELKNTKKGWTLPSDDKSITSGIKRLVRLGHLSIPGKGA